jgi:hypothetical protein
MRPRVAEPSGIQFSVENAPKKNMVILCFYESPTGLGMYFGIRFGHSYQRGI